MFGVMPVAPRWVRFVAPLLEVVYTWREFISETVVPNRDQYSLKFLTNFYIFERRVVLKRVLWSSGKGRRVYLRGGWCLCIQHPKPCGYFYAAQLIDDKGFEVLKWRRGLEGVKFDLVDHSVLARIGKVRLF